MLLFSYTCQLVAQGYRGSHMLKVVEPLPAEACSSLLTPYRPAWNTYYIKSLQFGANLLLQLVSSLRRCIKNFIEPLPSVYTCIRLYKILNLF